MSFRPITGPRPRLRRDVRPEPATSAEPVPAADPAPIPAPAPAPTPGLAPPDEAARHAARWRALVDAAPGPVIRFAASGRILEWNPAARIALGWTAEQARELTVADVLMTGERDERVRLEDVRRCDGTVVRAEVTIVADPGDRGGGGRMLFLRLPPG